MAAFRKTAAGRLALCEKLEGARDRDIYDLAVLLLSKGAAVFGLDAPLSYNPGGGDRRADAELRKRIVAAGLHPGSVMVPTMTRMAYLTLRGISVARMLQAIDRRGPCSVVEVHPGGAMALRGAPAADVRQFKTKAESRDRLLAWLERQGLQGASICPGPTEHFVAACASALAAWHWHRGQSVWLAPAQPPIHPFDYCC